MIVRRDAPDAVLTMAVTIGVTIGAAATIIGSLCPWATSGSVDRSSFEIIDLVDRLGFAEGGPFDLAVRAWPLMPLLVVTGAVAMWWRRHVVGLALSVVGGLYAFVIALSVELAPTTGLVRVRFGPIVTIAGASVLLAGTVVALVALVVASRDRQRQPAGLG